MLAGVRVQDSEVFEAGVEFERERLSLMGRECKNLHGAGESWSELENNAA